MIQEPSSWCDFPHGGSFDGTVFAVRECGFARCRHPRSSAFRGRTAGPQRVATEVDRRSRGDPTGQQIMMREISKVDEVEVQRRGSSDMDPREPERTFASRAVKIPKVLLMFLGLVFSHVSRILWALQILVG